MENLKFIPSKKKKKETRTDLQSKIVKFIKLPDI